MIVYVLAGLLLVAAGVAVLVADRRPSGELKAFRERAEHTEADVLEIRRRTVRTGSDVTVYQAPLVRFTLPDGNIVEAETMGAASLAPAKVGRRVQVRYDPLQPTRVDLASGRGQATNPSCALMAVGAGLVGLGVIVVMFGIFVAVVAGVSR